MVARILPVITSLALVALPTPDARAQEPVAVDLDGDGTDEWVRDGAVGAPFRACGLPAAWVSPEVQDTRGQFRRVRVLPDVTNLPPAETSPADIAAARPFAVPPRFASRDRSDAQPAGGPGDPFSLASRTGGWSPHVATGAWVRFDVPPELTATRLVVAGAAGTWILATDGELRSLRLDESDDAVAVHLSPDTRCVAMQWASETTESSMLLELARIETDASDAADWFRAWAEPRVRAACAAGDVALAERSAAAIAAAAVPVDRFAPLLQEPDACLQRAAAAHLETAAADDPDRVGWLTDSELVDDALAVLRASTSLSRTQWLRRLDSVSDPDQRARLLREAALADPSEEALSAAAERLWPLMEGDTDAVTDLLVGVRAEHLMPLRELATDVSTARRTLLTLARAEPAPTGWVQRLVDQALRHDDGSVARLGILVAARFRNHGVELDAERLLERDPAPHLRVEAMRYLVAGGEHEVSRAVLLEDESATVRAAAAALLRSTPEDIEAARVALAREPWPDVREAIIEALWRQHSDAAYAVLGQHLGGSAPVDVERMTPLLAARADGLPQVFDGVVERDDLAAWVLVRWLDALIRGPGDPARLAMLHADASDASLRRAALDGLTGAPALALPRARQALADTDDRVRATAVALLCTLGDTADIDLALAVSRDDQMPLTQASVAECVPPVD